MSRSTLGGRQQGPEQESEPDASDVPGLIHALRVYQHELEAQNEELRQACAELETLRSSLEDLFQHAPAALVNVDAKGAITLVNHAAELLFGLDNHALVGRQITSLIREEDTDRFERSRHLVESESGSQVLEARVLRVEETRWARISMMAASPKSGPGAGTAFRTAFVDITEQRQLEASLAQAEKMASMGMLAAGVAHEINNPLSYILPTLESAMVERAPLRELIPQDAQGSEFDELTQRLEHAYQGARRVKDIVRGLTSVSRASSAGATGDLHQAMRHALIVASNELRFVASVQEQLSEVDNVRLAEGKAAQVLLNLILNAVHAFDEQRSGQRNQIAVATWQTGDRVWASVTDNGCGMSGSVQARVFDPFYTTKGAERGTGLGLAICRDIIHEAGGDIQLRSALSEGTRVAFWLPAAPRGPQVAEAKPSITDALRRRVLIVDDEPEVARAIRRLLKAQHDVVVVRSGLEAQQLLTTDDSFDAILCDVMMPDFSGIQLLRWLQSHSPSMARHTVLMSGGVSSKEIQRELAEVPNRLLHKPVDRSTLLEVVQNPDYSPE